MFMRFVTTAIVGLMLSACAAQSQQQPAWHWEKPNLDQAQFNKDVYECMKEARDPAWGVGFNPYMRDACLKARGYRQVLNQPQRR
jgi:hypothetical protein